MLGVVLGRIVATQHDALIADDAADAVNRVRIHTPRIHALLGMETRLLQAQSENTASIDLISTLVSDDLACRSKRLLERRHKQAQFRDADKGLDNFDFQFNARMNRNLVFELAPANWVGKREDAPLLVRLAAGKVTAHKPSDTPSSSSAAHNSARGLAVHRQSPLAFHPCFVQPPPGVGRGTVPIYGLGGRGCRRLILQSLPELSCCA